jgi:hypothetical protein
MFNIKSRKLSLTIVYSATDLHMPARPEPKRTWLVWKFQIPNSKFQTKRRPSDLFFKAKNNCSHFSVPGMLFKRGFPGHGLKILAKKTRS